MKKIDPSIYENERTLVNFSNSILAHYGAKTFHKPLDFILKAMEGHRKIAVFLFDGMGTYVMDEHLFVSRKLRSHEIGKIYSTTPATTVAATTGFLSAKYPIENGYLGWAMQTKDYENPISVFPNTDNWTDKPLDKPNYFATRFPYERLDVLLKKAGVNARTQFPKPIDPNGHSSKKEMMQMATSFFKDEGGEFLYGYWSKPDGTIHKYGVKSWRVGKEIHEIKKAVYSFIKKNPDVLTLVFADHGLIDIYYHNIVDHPDLMDCLAKHISLEGRLPNFFLKEGKKEEFVFLFKKYFPSYALLNKEEALKIGLFGEGVIKPEIEEMIGDFVAVALSKETIVEAPSSRDFTFLKAHHAGGLIEERQITIMSFN